MLGGATETLLDKLPSRLIISASAFWLAVAQKVEEAAATNVPAVQRSPNAT